MSHFQRRNAKLRQISPGRYPPYYYHSVHTTQTGAEAETIISSDPIVTDNPPSVPSSIESTSEIVPTATTTLSWYIWVLIAIGTVLFIGAVVMGIFYFLGLFWWSSTASTIAVIHHKSSSTGGLNLGGGEGNNPTSSSISPVPSSSPVPPSSSPLVLPFSSSSSIYVPVIYQVCGDNWNFGTTCNSITANVGDTLFFNFGATHTVNLMASQAAYTACSFSGATLFAGPGGGPYSFVIPSQDAGLTIYFACSIATHCSSGGMKLTVNVNGIPIPLSSSPPSPSSSASGIQSSSTISLHSSSNIPSYSSSSSIFIPITYVIIGAGQSNMQGEACCAVPEYDTGYSNMTQFVIGDPWSDNSYTTPAADTISGQFKPADEPLYDGGSNRANIIGPMVNYAKLTTSGNQTVLIQGAVSASSFQACLNAGGGCGQWPSTIPGPIDPINNFFYRILIQLNNLNISYPGFQVKSIIWLQGESDNGNSNYQSLLIALFNGMRTYWPGVTSTTPIILGSMVPEYTVNSGGASYQAIYQIHRAIPNLVPYTAFRNMILGNVDCAEAIHYSATGQRILAQMYAQGYIDAMLNTQTGLIPNHPDPSQVTLSLINNCEVNIVWTVPTISNTAIINGYYILYALYTPTTGTYPNCPSSDPSPPIKLYVANNSTTTYTFSVGTLLANTQYQFDVASVSGSQMSSGNYNSFHIFSTGLCQPPASSSSSPHTNTFSSTSSSSPQSNTFSSISPSSSSFTGEIVNITLSPSPLIWLDSRSIPTATASISTWSDSSGNGNTALQATFANQPSYILNAINGIPAVQFTGTQWFATPSVFPTSSDYTITVMFSSPTSASTAPALNILSGNSLGAGAHACAIAYQQSGVTGLTVYHTGYFPAGNLTMPFNNEIVIVTIVYIYTTDTIQYYMGGYNAGAYTGTQSAVTDASMNIGAFDPASLNNDFIGNMIEIVLWNRALTSNQVSTNELQFANLANITYPQLCTFFPC